MIYSNLQYRTATSDAGCPALDEPMTISAVLLIVLVLLLVGALPVYPHSRDWGYYPSGGIGTVLIIILILYFLGVV